jgi:hypothetical protein
VASLIELLIKVQLIYERQHEAVASRAKSTAGGHVVQQIAEMGYATEGTVARAISVELGLPRIDLAITPPEPAASTLLDARTCAERFVLPVALRENGELLWLAMADPTDNEAVELVRRRTQKRVRPAVAGPTEILRMVRAIHTAAAGQAPEPVDAHHLSPDTAHPHPASSAAAPDASPLSRIARQLGVEVPTNLPARKRRVKGSVDPAEERDLPPAGPAPRGGSLDEVLAPAADSGEIESDDLSDEDLATLKALRVSLEKGAHILRSLAELCVEKKVFTREEMKGRHSRA